MAWNFLWCQRNFPNIWWDINILLNRLTLTILKSNSWSKYADMLTSPVWQKLWVVSLPWRVPFKCLTPFPTRKTSNLFAHVPCDAIQKWKVLILLHYSWLLDIMVIANCVNFSRGFFSHAWGWFTLWQRPMLINFLSSILPEVKIQQTWEVQHNLGTYQKTISNTTSDFKKAGIQ